MIHSRRKSIPLNRIEWLIKGSKSWLESCTDLITLGEKLAMSSWTIFPFVFWPRVTIKWLSYENLSKQVMPWSGSVGKRVLKRLLKCWQTGMWTNTICPSQHFCFLVETAQQWQVPETNTWDFPEQPTAVPQSLCGLRMNDLGCDMLQLQLRTDSKSNLQEMFRHVRNLIYERRFQILEPSISVNQM